MASFTLRSGLRDGDSHRFLASCCVTVEAPRGATPSSIVLPIAWRISPRSKPVCEKKLMSSATSTARLRCGEILA